MWTSCSVGSGSPLGQKRRGPLWGKSRVGAEIDSYLHHSSPPDWAADRSRNNLLRAQGLTLLNVTEPDMRSDPAGVAAQFEEALVSRGVR
jgi:very-short-patch-repair endonuclease